MTYVYGTSYKDSSVPTKDWFNYTVTENASQYIIGLTAGVYHTPSDHLAHSISSKTVYLQAQGKQHKLAHYRQLLYRMVLHEDEQQ